MMVGLPVTSKELHTETDEAGDVAVGGDFGVGDLLHGLVDGVEEGFCLVGARHGEGLVDGYEEMNGVSRDGHIGTTIERYEDCLWSIELWMVS